MNISMIFLGLFGVDAAVNIAANVNEQKNIKIIYVTKPFLMPLLIMHYVTSAPAINWLIVSALVFGFLGDVFLMIPGDKEKWFMAGLVSFLVNQILYIVAFVQSVGSYESLQLWLVLLIIPFLVYGAAFYRVIEKNLASMKIPVIVYMVVILLMGISALLRRVSFQGLSFWLVLAGALCFIVSDSILAYDKFKRRLRFGRMAIMFTYIVAQYLIASGCIVE